MTSSPSSPARPGAFPTVRLRRNRAQRLVPPHGPGNGSEPADLIWPMFVIEGTNAREPVATMPGVTRLSVDLIVEQAREAQSLGIPAIALFPNTAPALRTDDAREAFNPDNLVCRATRAVKAAGIDVGIILDVALDPYTSHGHDGCSVTASSSTTKPSKLSSVSRSCRWKPAPTFWHLPT